MAEITATGEGTDTPLVRKLVARVAELEAALRVYADGWGDAGQIAREALGDATKEEGANG